jgi:O-antigen ligase
MARAIITDYPWTGIGPGGIGAVYDEYKTGVLVTDSRDWPHVHNDVLEVALSHGIPATLVWLVLAVWLYYALARRLLRYRGLVGSWTKAGFAGAGVSLHLFYLCGLVHDNYPIYIKVCLLLFLWGLVVSTDRQLGSLQPESVATAAEGVAA